jgi:hypothetical protein
MSSHSRFLELAAAQLDFELTTAEAVELQGHLATCTVCPSDVRGLRADADLLAGMPVLQMAPHREASVFARILGVPRAASAARRVAIAALLALLALGLALIGAEVIRRISIDRLITYVAPSPTASARPTPSLAPTVGPVAAELQGWWVGPNKPLPGLCCARGTVLEITGTEVGIYGDDGRGGGAENRPLLAAPTAASDGVIRMVGVSDDWPSCEPTSSGAYPYGISPSGETLTIDAGTDDCPSRSHSLPGTWWRDDCPGRSDPSAPPQEFFTCLGTLDAGTYRSQYFAVMAPIGPGGFGSLTYTVPEGWANYLASTFNYGLTTHESASTIWPSGPFPAMSLDLLPDVQIKLPEELCKDRGLTTSRDTMPQMIASLANLPGLVVTAPTSLTVDAHPAAYVDLRFDLATAPTCTRTSAHPRRWPDPSVDYLKFIDGGAVNAHHRQRLILVDTGLESTIQDEPGYRPVVLGIRIDVEDTLDFDAEVARAMPVIATFHFLAH